jgi:acyl-CoA thioester hydrolase
MPRSDFKFFYPLRVRYAETDAQGIVFNAHYLTYFDTAIYEYFRSLPFDYLAHVRIRGQDFHTVKVVVEFHRPCHFDDEIDVCVRVFRLGRSSLTFQIEIFLKAGEELYASGQVIWVNADQRTNASTGLPPELVELVKLREAIPDDER